MGRYMPQSELEQAEDFERKNIAEQLLFYIGILTAIRQDNFFLPSVLFMKPELTFRI